MWAGQLGGLGVTEASVCARLPHLDARGEVLSGTSGNQRRKWPRERRGSGGFPRPGAGRDGGQVSGLLKGSMQKGSEKGAGEHSWEPVPLATLGPGLGSQSVLQGALQEGGEREGLELPGGAWPEQDGSLVGTSRWLVPSVGGARERRTPSPAGVLASTPCPVPSPSAGQRDLCLCRQRDALRPGLAEHLGRDPELPGAGQAAAAPALAAAGAVGAGPGGGREPTLPWAAVSTG